MKIIANYAAIFFASLILHSPKLFAQNEKPTKTAAAATVTIASVSKAKWTQSLEAQGAISSWQDALVGARVAGLPLEEIRVNVGDQVKRGDLLARFDDRTVRAEIAQAEANLAQAEANLKQANANRERVLTLQNKKAISEQDALQFITQAKTTLAQKALVEATLASLKVRLEGTRVLAPDDGVISSLSAMLGQVPAIGTELFRLIRQGRLEWRAELTAQQIAQVHIGMSANLTLPDGSKLVGKVRQLAPALDVNSRLGIAYVDLPAHGSARAAMYANGRIELNQSDALIIPADSVVIRDGRTSVFVLNKEQVQQVSVSTGRRQAGQIEILQGMKLGDQVVVRGAGFLNDGDLVKVVSGDVAEAK